MSSELIPGYPKGYDLTIMNTYYNRGKKQEDGKWSKDALTCLYRDNVTGKKHLCRIEEPEYTFFMANDDVYIDYNMFFIEQEKVHPVTVKYNQLLKTIAELTGNEELYYDNIRNGNRRANELLHTVRSVFNSDMDLQDHFRFQFGLNYVNDPSYVPTKAYSDIETDTNYQKGDFPEFGEVPINSISYIDEAHRKIILFALVDPNNQSSIECEEYAKTHDIAKECKEYCENHIGQKRAHLYEVDQFEYEFVFYHDERQMLIDFYKIINFFEPDVLMYWNGAGFDNPYIIARLLVLGLDPAAVVSTKDAPEQICDYYIDERNKNVPAQRGDWTFFSNHTIIIDQMIQFASRRKGQSAFDNNKLDYIAKKVAKVGKHDWSKRFRTFAEFIRGDFKSFLFYNVGDTLAQYCIEHKVKDIDYMFSKCIMNNTRFEKCHRQTIYLTNRGIKEFRADGFIMGNNHNKQNEKPPKFPGALVGDPTHNNDYAKMEICGEKVNIMNNLDDFDYKSLYPSIMREFNIAPNTQIGRLLIEQVVWQGENPFQYNKYARGGQFFEDMNSDNIIEFCKRWFHLAGYKEMLQDMNEYFTLKRAPYGIINPLAQQPLIRQYEIKPKTNLIERKVSAGRTSLIIMHPKKRDFKKEIEWLNNNAQMDIDDVDAILARKKREAEEDAELEKFFTEMVDPAKVAAAKAEEDNDE